MILKVNNLVKTFDSHQNSLRIIEGLDLQVSKGETVSIIGQSGSGKSTLLSLIAGLDRPTSGEIFVEGVDLASMPQSAITAYRAQKIGIIFQQFHLMPHLNALENIALPLELLGERDTNERAAQALERVGLQDRSRHFPRELSGGENQRVAIARALVIRPALLLADEPTGNLDEAAASSIQAFSFRACQKECHDHAPCNPRR